MVILNENSQMRDVYDAVADPTRRKLLRLLADVEELPLHELTVQFQMGRTEPHQLSYTCGSGSLLTTVIWTLKKTADGTIHLHLDHRIRR
jgi:DNA-binding transcriptional ArsR family regulator